MLINNLPIICINLDKSPERWERVKSNCSEFNQSITRFPACDGKLTPDADFPPLWEKVNRDSNSGFKSGIAGCALSHYRAWQLMVENNIEYLCILEDDAHIVKKIENISYHTDFDLLYISNRVGANYKGEIVCGCGTEAYIVSNSGAKKLLDVCEDLCVPVDLRIQAHARGFIESNHELCRGGFKSSKNSHVILESYKTEFNYTVHNDYGVSYVNQ